MRTRLFSSLPEMYSDSGITYCTALSLTAEQGLKMSWNSTKIEVWKLEMSAAEKQCSKIIGIDQSPPASAGIFAISLVFWRKGKQSLCYRGPLRHRTLLHDISRTGLCGAGRLPGPWFWRYRCARRASPAEWRRIAAHHLASWPPFHSSSSDRPIPTV